MDNALEDEFELWKMGRSVEGGSGEGSDGIGGVGSDRTVGDVRREYRDERSGDRESEENEEGIGGIDIDAEYDYSGVGEYKIEGLDIDGSSDELEEEEVEKRRRVVRNSSGKRKARCISISNRAWDKLTELAVEFECGSGGRVGSVSGLIEDIGLGILKIR